MTIERVEQLKGLAPGTYEVRGKAAEALKQEEIRRLYLEVKHRPENNGFGQCNLCQRPIHQMTYVVERRTPFGQISLIVRRAWRHNPIPRTKVINDRDRRFCSSCNKPGEWYEFKPGDGRCNRCAP